MIRIPSAAHTTGFFQFQGRSHGASCLRVVKTVPFAAPSGLKSSFRFYMAGKSTLNPLGHDTQIAAHPALRPLPPAALQTQNA
jgi:hypothetical protein